MTEEITAGGKEFIITMAWAAVLYIICAAVMSAFNKYAFIGGIIALVVFAIFGFFVLTRYASRFTYTLKNGQLRINRLIGKRNREVEMSCSDIVNMCYGVKPSGFVKRPVYMRKSIISDKYSLFIHYRGKDGEDCGVVIEPSAKLRKRIEKGRSQQ